MGEHALEEYQERAVSVSGIAHLEPLRCGDESRAVELLNDEKASSSSGAKEWRWRIDGSSHISGSTMIAEGGTG